MIFLIISCIFIIIYTYALYPLILTIMISVKHQPGIPTGERNEEFQPSVSMVISAYNEENDIKNKIENFLQLDYSPEKIELLIGSDGSTDKTASITRSLLNERVKLFEYKEWRGKVNVLNDIVPGATGEIVIFSDADTIYGKKAIEMLVRHFRDQSVGGVCGKLLLEERVGSITEEGLYWKYENYIKEKESKLDTIVSINGQIFAIRKSLFEALPPDTITEDQALGMRIIGKGYRILFDPEAVASEAIGSLKDEFERRARISAGNFQSVFSSVKVLSPTSGFASFALWSHKIFRWLAPFLLIAIFLINLSLLEIDFFRFFFYAQIIFYSLPSCDHILNKIGMQSKMLHAIYYFNIMNLAILVGFARFITGRQRVTWRRTERQGVTG